MRRRYVCSLAFLLTGVAFLPGCGDAKNAGDKTDGTTEKSDADSSAASDTNRGPSADNNGTTQSSKPNDGASTAADSTTNTAGATSADLDKPLVAPTAKEVLAVIDLRTFPVMDGASREYKTATGSHFSIEKADKTTIKRAAEFYRTKLAELGWTHEPEFDSVNDESAELFFAKNGNRLSVGMGISRGDGNFNTGIANLANLDARRLPRPSGAELKTFKPSSVWFVAAATLDATKAHIRAEMKKQGWSEYATPTRAGSPPPAKENEYVLAFVNRAAVAKYTRQSPPDAPAGKVEYAASVSVLDQQLPILPDATNIAFSENPAAVYYHTASTFEHALEYNQKELSAIGYKERAGKTKIEKPSAEFTLEAPGQPPLRLEILANEGLTIVRILTLRE
jgi:hypothetical protein